MSWNLKTKTTSIGSNKARKLAPHYLVFQNGDFIELQNGDLLKTGDGAYDWTYKTKIPA